MECNKEEAIRAKNIAKNKMINDDFDGGRKYAVKAQKLFPELENISHMLAVCDVHCSAKRKINGAAKDLYGILQVESSANVATIKKQYRKLALVLHPDKNQFPGAEAAFKLVGEANTILCDYVKRISHDNACRDPAKPTIPKPQNPQRHQSSKYGDQNKSCNDYQQSQSGSNVQPKFWTFCPSCKANYEYFRDLVYRRVKCQNCEKLFLAIDISSFKSTQTPNPGRTSTQNVNPRTNTCPPTSSQREGVAKEEKSKVDPQRAEPSFSHSACQPPQCTKNGNRKTKGGKEGDAKEGTGSNPSSSSRKPVRCSSGDKLQRDAPGRDHSFTGSSLLDNLFQSVDGTMLLGALIIVCVLYL